jgi:hypothetical protein
MQWVPLNSGFVKTFPSLIFGTKIAASEICAFVRCADMALSCFKKQASMRQSQRFWVAAVVKSRCPVVKAAHIETKVQIDISLANKSVSAQFPH